tara:strand:- start:86 stop:1564 length:1479 start_codon:yes stop_codon:yes gene_type:complete
LTKKIIFFLDLFTLHFGLADFFQKNTNYELFALIDTTDKPKKFFQNQKIVNFTKTWYYHDNIDPKKKYENDYLQNFASKYFLNHKQMIENDRFFSHFNNFYKFSDDEITSILTQEAKLYENIIDICKPDFLIMFQPSLRHEFVFYHICKMNGVIPLIINPSIMGYKTYISDQVGLSKKINLDTKTLTNKSFEELQQYYLEHNVNQQIIDYVNSFSNSSSNLIKAGIEFLFRSNNSNEKTHYTYFGRKKIIVFIDVIKNKLRKKLRKNFIDKNLNKQIPSKNFIYFPLQVEPDRNLLLGAPDFTDQINSIKNILNALPKNYILCVKEHPGQKKTWRPISFYKEILNLENVVLLHPSVKSSKILKKTSMVITAVGTSGFEALFYGKPVIIFAETLYSILPSVQKMDKFENLSNLIINGLKMEPSPEPLERFLFSLEKNSFDFDLFGYYSMQAHDFFYDSNLIDVEISNEKMDKFLKNNKEIFESIGNHIMEHTN